MKFKLQAPYQPQGDQPQAIKQLTQSVQAGNTHQALLGVTGSGKTFTLANLIENTQLPTLVISHNKTLAAQLYQEFRDFFPDNAVSYFVSYYDYYQPESYIPSTDTYIEKETTINEEIDKLRLSTTANLLSRPDVIVVASVSCIYNLGSPIEYGKNILELVAGQLIKRSVFFHRLIDMQYVRNDLEVSRGTFRVRGDQIHLWPANADQPLLISMLDDVIETITPVDPITQDPITRHDLSYNPRFTIYPAKLYQSPKTDYLPVFAQIKADLALRLQELKSQGKVVEAYRLAQRTKHDLEMIQELGYVNGIENYSRYFDGRNPGDPPYTMLDYFAHNIKEFNKSSYLTIIDESHITLPQLRGMYAGDRSRKQNLIDFGFRLPSALDNRPLQFSEIMPRLPQVIFASATPEEYELSLSQPHIAQQLIRPTGLVDPDIEVRPTRAQITDLLQEILTRVSKQQRVLVTTLTKRTAEALTEFLNDKEKIQSLIKDDNNQMKKGEFNFPKVAYLHADVETLERSDILDSLRSGEYDVIVGINLLREGLDLPEVSLVAILEADKQGFLRSKNSLIQTMGRAARHQDGHVIMYADRISDAMRQAMEEVSRRREIQLQFNQTHGITPLSILKPIRSRLLIKMEEEDVSISLPKSSRELVKNLGWKQLEDVNPDSLSPKDKADLIKSLRRQMNQAAKDWEFETAALLRDTIAKLES